MKVRSWYGLTGEIIVENQLWHLVKVGRVNLPHPPLVNLLIRRGLPKEDRLRLSYLHEFGHFQTLPLTALPLFFLSWAGLRRRRSLRDWLLWAVGLGVAHEAVWELASEAYVVLHEGRAYRQAYRNKPSLFLPLFWVVMGGLSIGLSWRLVKTSEQ